MGSGRTSRIAWSLFIALACLRICNAAAQDRRAAPPSQAAPPQVPAGRPTPSTSIATTPLPGVDLPLDKIPAPVQTGDRRRHRRSGALDLSDFLNRRLNGVHVNEMQGNPFQPDVNYRGYTASPLLGTPQGLSVYMDGVRLNQPFGDVVSWDLIPRDGDRVDDADARIESAVRPQHARRRAVDPDQGRPQRRRARTVEAIYGSDARRARRVRARRHERATGCNWYLAGNLFAEDGWRDDSPSDVRQFFGKLGWQRRQTRRRAHRRATPTTRSPATACRSSGFLDRDYASVYTKPDDHRQPRDVRQSHRAAQPSARELTFSGNAYYRDIRTDTLNGDINEDSLDQSVYQPSAAEQAALAAAGYTGFPTSGANAANTPFPFWRCIGNVLLQDEPAEKCNGLLNRTRTAQHNGGASGQFTLARCVRRAAATSSPRAPAYDRSGVGFAQSTELGYLNPDRSVTGVGAFGDGVTGGNVDGEPFDTRVDLDGAIHTWSVLRPTRCRSATPGTSRCRAATTGRRIAQPRRASSPAAARARSTATTCSSGSTRRPA